MITKSFIVIYWYTFCFQNVQSKTIIEIARDLNTLQEKGLKGQLGLNELTGGTFTLSNIGIVSL